MKKRKYNQSTRSERAQKTRQKIVDATVKLHEELGPAKTTIKAIAEQAGVQRLTVYRHFPDENVLFDACTSQWLEAYPPPTVADVGKPADPRVQTEKTLLDVYRYYRETEQMWTVSYRDRDEVEALQRPMNQVEAYFSGMRDALLKAWKLRGKARNRVSITMRHGLRFSTWQSLSQENLEDREMVELIMGWCDKSV